MSGQSTLPSSAHQNKDSKKRQTLHKTLYFLLVIREATGAWPHLYGTFHEMSLFTYTFWIIILNNNKSFVFASNWFYIKYNKLKYLIIPELRFKMQFYKSRKAKTLKWPISICDVLLKNSKSLVWSFLSSV